MAGKLNLEKGFRVVVNSGPDACESVPTSTSTFSLGARWAGPRADGIVAASSRAVPLVPEGRRPKAHYRLDAPSLTLAIRCSVSIYSHIGRARPAPELSHGRKEFGRRIADDPVVVVCRWLRRRP